MKKQKMLLILMLAIAGFGVVQAVTTERSDLASYSAIAHTALGKKVIWKNLYNPRQRDQLYEPVNVLKVLPYHDAGLTLFFSRTTELANGLKDIFQLEAFRAAARQGLELKLATEHAVDEPDTLYPNYSFNESPTAEETTDYNNAVATFEAATKGKATTISDSIYNYANLMTFQEHRLGLGLAKEWREGRWCASIRTWLGMAERNYWLGAEGRKNIAELVGVTFPGMDGRFNAKDFIAMRWGFGDTHLKLGYVLPVTRQIEVTAGVRAVLPTARKQLRPTKNKIMPLESTPFLGFARKRANEVLIEPCLGNNGHYGLGLWGEAVWNRLKPTDRNKISAQMYGGFDYLVPTNEERFFLHKYEAITGTLATRFKTDDTAFRSFLHQYFIPKPVTVIVAPGVVAQAGALVQARFEKASLFAGYDFYHKDEEVLDRFAVADDADTYLLRQKDFALSVTPAEEMRANKHQHKVYFGCAHNTSHHNVYILSQCLKRLNLSLSLHGAVALHSKNMGDDFVIGLSAGLSC